jgi:hypothetical protein
MDCLTILNASNCDVGGFICPKSPHVTQILNSSFLLLGPSASLLTSIVLAPSTPEASTLSCALSSLCLKHILLKNECQLKRLNSSGLLTEYNRKCHLNCHKQMRYFISNVSRGVGYRHVVRQAELDPISRDLVLVYFYVSALEVTPKLVLTHIYDYFVASGL